MDTLILSESEIRIIEALRSLKPFERIEIVADNNGKEGYFYIHRSSKINLMDGELRYVK